MSRLFTRIITGILLAYLAATISLHVITTLFWGRIFTDHTYYPIKHTSELIQSIIDQTPQDKISQEIEYLSRILDRPLDVVPADDVVIPEAVKQKLTDGRIVYDNSKNGDKKFFAPVKNSRLVVLIDPSFQQYRPPKNILSSILQSTIVLMIVAFVGFKLTRPLTRRVVALESAAIKISQGDVAARVQNNSEDLVGKVEKCFNKMADRIQILITTRQALLSNILKKFEAPIVQIDECIKQWHANISTSQKKRLSHKINSVTKDITQLVNDLLRQERSRQLEGNSINTVSATKENPGNSTSSNQKRSDAHAQSRSTANPLALKASIIKFIFLISAGIFTVLIANQLIMLIAPQTLFKYTGITPSGYGVHTISSLIQREVDITPQEELSARLELLQKKLDRKLDLIPAVKAESLFTRTLEREYAGGITYGVLDGKMVFRAPIHSGTYSLMIETPTHLYRRNPNPFYHTMVFFGWFVLTIFFGILLSMPIIRNLKKLMEGIERLRLDDLNARVDIPPNKPIGVLACHFNSMAEHIQLLMENQQHLLQAIVHDIRTPLSRIHFHIEILMDSEDSKEMDRDAEDVEVEINELKLLLKELSTFMEFDAMTGKFEFEPISLRNTLLEIVSYFQKTSPTIKIRLRDDKKENLEINVHPVYFKMAVGNLISNAIRHAHQNVTISYGLEKEELFVEICDDGPGIPDHAKKSVLEPFTRLDNSRNRESGGFGLGLAIANRIMQLHNGAIEIFDNTPQGTEIKTFWPILHPC